MNHSFCLGSVYDTRDCDDEWLMNEIVMQWEENNLRYFNSKIQTEIQMKLSKLLKLKDTRLL